MRIYNQKCLETNARKNLFTIIPNRIHRAATCKLCVNHYHIVHLYSTLLTISSSNIIQDEPIYGRVEYASALHNSSWLSINGSFTLLRDRSNAE